jgi:hypothetical protein
VTALIVARSGEGNIVKGIKGESVASNIMRGRQRGAGRSAGSALHSPKTIFDRICAGSGRIIFRAKKKDEQVGLPVLEEIR